MINGVISIEMAFFIFCNLKLMKSYRTKLMNSCNLNLVMRIFPFILFCVSPVFCWSQAERSTSGNMVYMLGRDTIAAGSYQLKNNKFSMHVLSRPPVTVTKLNGTLFSNGELKSAEGYAYKPSAGKDTQLLMQYRLYVEGDSTFIEQHPPGRPVVISRFPGRGFIANNMGASIRFFLPFWSFYAPEKTGDSLVSGHLVFSSNRKFILKRIAKNKIQAGSTVMGWVTLYTDRKGSVRYINAIGSSSNVRGFVVSRHDLDRLTKQFVLQETEKTGLAAINVLDSLQVSILEANIRIVYSRPERRGRKIFGAVVPYERVWRTGANAATRLVIDRPIVIGEKELPSGSYSLWTIPGPKKWTLIVNSQATVWGTEYNPQFDVLRVTMQVQALKQMTDQMTIEIQPLDRGGTIEISWEKTKATIPFTVK